MDSLLGHLKKITCLASTHFNFSRSGGRGFFFFGFFLLFFFVKCNTKFCEMQEIQYITTVKTHFNSFKIRSCFLIPFMFLIKQKITVWRSRANTLAANRHILGRKLCVNVLHSSQKNKITIFSSKTVFFIDSFCTKLGRI